METKPLLVSCTVTEVEIDECLVGNPRLLGERTKIRQRILIEPDRYLFLQTLRVGIFPRV